MRALVEKRVPVRVVDIAAGHGRYVLDALAESGITPDSILLRDYSDLNVAAGTELIEQCGLSGIARFVKGDAFDRDSLALLVGFFVLVVQASDVFQYVWGKLLGRHKIAPSLSPSKTVKGFAGGVLSATALGATLWWLTPFSPWHAGLMALVVTLEHDRIRLKHFRHPRESGGPGACDGTVALDSRFRGNDGST